MSSVETPDARPLRADARRNRERVLAAARDALADHGLDAQIDDIAERAGVGVGTVYRHFPTKEALFDALVGERWLKLAEAAGPSFDADDAWEGLTDFLWRAAYLHRDNRAWGQLAAAAPLEFGRDEQQELLRVTGELLKRAQKSGQARKDLTAQDIGMLMCGTCGVMQTTGDDRWERFFSIALEGLRARTSGRSRRA